MKFPKLTWLGVALTERRLAHGWTIGQLAELSGVDKSTISRLEAGITATAHDANLEKLAQVLLVDVQDLKDLGQRPAAPPSDTAMEWVEGLLPPESYPSDLRQMEKTSRSPFVSSSVPSLTAEPDRRPERQSALERELRDAVDELARLLSERAETDERCEKLKRGWERLISLLGREEWEALRGALDSHLAEKRLEARDPAGKRRSVPPKAG